MLREPRPRGTCDGLRLYSTASTRPLGFSNDTDGVSAAAQSADTPNDMLDERVPLRASFPTALRTHAIPLLLFFAAAVAALVLALR